MALVAQVYGSEDIAKFYRNAMVDRDRALGNIRIKYKGIPFAEFEDSVAAEADPVKYQMLAALGRQIERPVTMRPMDDPGKVAQVAKDELLYGIDRNIEMQRKAFANQPASVQATMEKTLLADIIDERDALARIDPADIEVDAPTGKIYKVALSLKPDELLDYDLDIARMPKEMRAKIEAAARRAIEMSRDPEINNIDPYDPENAAHCWRFLLCGQRKSFL